MYSCKLDIRIFSEQPLLPEVIEKIAPMERFTHAFKWFRRFLPEAVGDADIVIMDLPGEPQTLRRLCKQGAVLVLCLGQEAYASLRAPSLRALDDVWVKPLGAESVGVRFEKLLETLRQRKECRLAQTYLDTLIDSIPDLVWFKDIRGAHLKVNDSFCHMVGKTKEDIAGRGHYYIWDMKKEEYEQGEYVCLESEDIVLAERKTCLFDEKVKSKQGFRQFKTYKSPLFDEDGSLMGTVGIAHDVTDLANMGAELELILRNMPFSVLISDNDGRIVNANAKFQEYFSTRESDIVGKSYADWKRSILNGGDDPAPGHFETRIRRNGEERVLEIHEEPIFDIFRNHVGQFCFCRDVTIERTFEHQIWLSANTDSLTGLYNRRFFYGCVNEKRGQGQLSLLYVDLDNFKMVNDVYGHHVGDEALALVSGLMREAFPDDIIVRLGGDEFLVCMLGERSREYLETRADELLHMLLETFQTSDRLRVMSASIGIAFATDPEVKVDDLIRQSDLAMYAAKQSGKSRYCVYSPELARSV